MSAANAAVVDTALIAALAADAQLAALLPDGIYLDVAPSNKTRFVIVQFQTKAITEAFGDAAQYEVLQYRITARALMSTGADANAAAYRIDQLLSWTPLGPMDGFAHMATLQVERVKFTEVDAIDNDIRWQIAGADYEIFVSPATSGVPSEFTPTFHGFAFDVT